MIKKIAIFLTTSLIIFLLTSPIYAQSDQQLFDEQSKKYKTFIIGENTIPGVTCGDAGNEHTDANKCCVAADIEEVPKDPFGEFACLSIPVPFGSDPKVCLSELLNKPIEIGLGLLQIDEVYKLQSKNNVN